VLDQPGPHRPFLGRARLTAGLCLLVLGLALTARDVWLGVSFRPWFSANDRIHFVFLLWAGVVLVLAGCGLAFRSRVAGLALAVVGPSVFLLAWSHGRWWF
jgi:hypothetical protein